MYEEKDLVQAKNLLKALKQGKWTLEGEEILAFQQMFSWAIGMAIKIEDQLKNQKAMKDVAIESIAPKNANTTKAKNKKVAD